MCPNLIFLKAYQILDIFIQINKEKLHVYFKISAKNITLSIYLNLSFLHMA